MRLTILPPSVRRLSRKCGCPDISQTYELPLPVNRESFTCTLQWWNIVLLIIRFLDVSKFTTLTPLSLLRGNFVYTLIPNCWCENDFPIYFGIEIS
jgi:hypothetical protein